MTGNPLRDEATAFHWVLGAVVVLAVIVAASWISTWLGIAVVVLLAVVAAWCLMSSRRNRPKPPPAESASVEDTPEP